MCWEGEKEIWGSFPEVWRMGKSTECMNKGVVWSEERIDEGVLWWFIHVERIENVRIAKRVYVGKYW